MTSAVFLHGCPGNAASWDPLLPHLPGAEAWDLLDHGDRDAPDATLDDLIGDVVERLASRAAPVVLVGHSFGAWVALHAAARAPDRVAKLVLISGLPDVTGETAESLVGFAAALESGALPLEATPDVAAERWLDPDVDDADGLARIRALLLGDTITRLARQLRRAALASVPVPIPSVPAIVLHASGDRAIPVALGESLADRLGVPLVRFPGAGHFVHWTDPVGVARHIL